MHGRIDCDIRLPKRFIVNVLTVLVILGVLFSAVCVRNPEITSVLAQGEPGLQLEIQPKKIKVKVGDTVPLNVTIRASSEFKEATRVDLTLKVMNFSYDFDLGTVSPPYPRSFLYNLSIPDFIPMSMTAYGVLKATSGTNLRQDQMEIYIDVPLDPLKLPERIFKAFFEISNRLLNMSATWVPTVENAFSSGLMAVGTTIVMSSLALAGQDSASSFPGSSVLKKIFDLFPTGVKKWLSAYISSKSRPKEKKRSRRKELSSILTGASIITLAFVYVRSTNTIQILLLIPYVLGTSVLIELARDLTAKAAARIHGVSSELRLFYMGLAVFALSTIFFKAPISSPKKIYYESEKSTNRSRGVVSTVMVLMPMILFVTFYVLFVKGFTFFGNMGMTICLITALNDTLPIQPMNGKNIYNWNKALWACLFVGSFFFYLLQFIIF